MRPSTSNDYWRIYAFIILSLTLSVFTQIGQAAKIQEVEVTGIGYGDSPDAALRDALINAISQVNGAAVASSINIEDNTRATVTAESSDGKESTSAIQEDDSNISESFEAKTKGVIASYKIISQKKTDAGDYSAEVSAKIAKLARNAQLDRKKIAVVWSQTGDTDLSALLSETVTRLLTSSRKFAVLDRKNEAVIRDQLNRIRRGEGSVADQARLEATEAPDFLAVVHVKSEKKSNTKDYAYGYLEFIDYASRQVMFSERKTMILDLEKPEKTRRRVDVLAKSLTRSVIESVFPPTVVAFSGVDITISQGKDFFNKGDDVTIFEWGDILKDPATDEYLTRDRVEIGKGVITFVDARVAKATLDEQARFNMREIAKGKYVVSRIKNKSPKEETKSVSDLLD